MKRHHTSSPSAPDITALGQSVISPQIINEAESVSPFTTQTDQALAAIRATQKRLQSFPDTGYNTQAIWGKFVTLAELQSNTQQLIEKFTPLATQLPPETIANLQTKNNTVQTHLNQAKKHLEDHTIAADRTTLRKHLYDITSQLDITLDTLSIDINNIASQATPTTETDSSTRNIKGELNALSAALAHEKQTILVGDLGQSTKSRMLRNLHKLTCLVYRIRQLEHDPRFQAKKSQLMASALQIADTVNSLDIESGNAADLLEETAYAVERKLYRYEYDRFWAPKLGWVINRYQDITRLKSAQARILSGLAISLTISGSIFVVATIFLTLVSSYASESETKQRNELDNQRVELISKVDDFLKNDAELEYKQTQINNLERQIQDLDNRIEGSKNPSEGQKLGGAAPAPAAPTPEAAGGQDPKQTDTLADLEKEKVVLLEQKSDLDISREKLTQRTLKVEMIQRLRRLQGIAVVSEPDIEAANPENKAASTDKEVTEKQGIEPGAVNQRETLASINSTERENGFVYRQVQAIASFINNESLLNHSRRIVLAAFAGAIGSMMSILIRLDQLDEENIKNPFLLGALKPLIGGIFGISIFAILSTQVIDILPSKFYLNEHQVAQTVDPTSPNHSHPNLTATSRDPLGDLDSQEFYKIFLVAFIAGFSERLASDTLKSVSASK